MILTNDHSLSTTIIWVYIVLSLIILLSLVPEHHNLPIIWCRSQLPKLPLALSSPSPKQLLHYRRHCLALVLCFMCWFFFFCCDFKLILFQHGLLFVADYSLGHNMMDAELPLWQNNCSTSSRKEFVSHVMQMQRQRLARVHSVCRHWQPKTNLTLAMLNHILVDDNHKVLYCSVPAQIGSDSLCFPLPTKLMSKCLTSIMTISWKALAFGIWTLTVKVRLYTKSRTITSLCSSDILWRDYYLLTWINSHNTISILGISSTNMLGRLFGDTDENRATNRSWRATTWSSQSLSST